MRLVPSPLCSQKSWEGLPLPGQDCSGLQQTTIWHLFYLVWTLLVSLWGQFSLLLLYVTCHSIGLLLSSLHRFLWPMSPRVWSSSPSSSQCLYQPASLFRGGFRLEGYPSITASSQLPSRTAPGKASVSLACLGEKGVLLPY